MSEQSENYYIDVDYVGRAVPLFGLALKTLFLTVITLGFYRFWMKARMRRYYWSAIQPGGAPLEYTGTGLEKLLGFLIAVVFLAIYLGLFNLGLSFIGLSFFEGNPFALNLSFLAAIPLIFFAQYRARRYILSRTTWRGLRFGMDQAAWKYTLAAIGHSLLTVLTLGILLPRQTFHLEKFVTDRTWYGDLKFQQGGTWKMLMRPWLMVIGTVIVIIAIAFFGLQTENGLFLLVIPFGYVAVIFALAYYGVVTFRTLAANKLAGENIRFESRIRTGRVIGVYVLGFIAITIAAFVLVLLLAALGGVLGIMAFQPDFSPEGIASQLEGAGAGLGFATIAYVLFGYFAFLLVLGALAQVLFIQPMLRHYAIETLIHNADEIETASQRPFDKNVEAEGFADALDVGAAI